MRSGIMIVAHQESQSEAVLSVSAAVAQRKEDFLSFFGPESLKSKCKAVFFDAQLPRLTDFLSSLRDFDTALLQPEDLHVLKRLELSLQSAENADLCMVKLVNPPRKSVASHGFRPGLLAVSRAESQCARGHSWP